MGELVPLYQALGAIGHSPADVDRCEIWQAAAMLLYEPPKPGGTSYTAGGLDPYIRQRLAEGPKVGTMTVPPRKPRAVPDPT